MGRLLGVCLAACLMGAVAVALTPPATPVPTLVAGISQYDEGDMTGSVLTLETVIRSLSVEPALHANDLSQAYLYRGAAFVRLAQEENAKGSFASALQYDKELRITEEKWPPRVVRVFEAARTGKTKSVLLPPSNVAKKAGIGALGVAAIVGGGIALAGGAVAVTHGSAQDVEPPVTTTTTTTTTLSTGTIVMRLVATAPPAGATISTTAVGPNLPPNALQVAVTLTSPGVSVDGHIWAAAQGVSCDWYFVQLYAGGGYSAVFHLPADVPVAFTLASTYVSGGCLLETGTTTIATTTVVVYFGKVLSGPRADATTAFNVPFTWKVTQG
jgi:hypothetical protein